MRYGTQTDVEMIEREMRRHEDEDEDEDESKYSDNKIAFTER